MTPGHPTPAELEQAAPSPEVARHLEACARCRVDRRLLLAGPPPGADPAPREALAAARRAGAAALAEVLAAGGGAAGGGAAGGGAAGGGAGGPSGYVLGELLGRGATAEVRRAFDPALRREVALKVLAREEPEARDRFLTEAQVTSQLDHPNIVPVHHLGVTPDGRPYVAMRVVRGQSLTEAVREGRLGSLEARVDALRKVCAAVAFAHARGVLHRDLKPDNVMVGEFGEIQVVDWGLARALGGAPERVHADRFEATADRTHDGHIAGTPAWMAPEQARGEIAALGVRSDVYSLGAVLFFLATGRPPVDDRDPAVALAAVREGRVPRPRDVDRRVPREIDAIVRRAMAFDPARRYPDVRALLDDLDAWLERRPLPHVGSRLADRVAKLAARNRGTVRALGGALGMGLALAGGGGWRYVRDVAEARDAAALEADRAREAERRGAIDEAEAQIALADAARLDGRGRDAAEALTRAAATLTATGGDTRNLELARAALHVVSPPPLATCRPLGGAALQAVAVSPAGTAAVALGEGGRVARWDPADCRALGEEVVAGDSLTVAWLADGPAVVARVGDELVHQRPGEGVLARTHLPARVGATARIGLTSWGEGTLLGDDERWWTFRFGDPTLRPEAPWPRPPAYVTLVPGGRAVLASLDPTDAAGGGLWDRRTLTLRQPGWYGGEVTHPRLALVDRPEGPAGVDLETREVRWTTAESRYVTVAGAPGGRFATLSWPGTVEVLDLASGATVSRVVTPPRWERVAPSRDARVLLAWGDDTVSTWLLDHPRASAFDGEVPSASSPVVATSPDGRLLAVAGVAGFAGIDLLDATSRARMRRIPAGAMAHALALSPDGATLAATFDGGGRAAWTVATGDERWRVTDGETLPLAWVGDDPVTVAASGDLLVLAAADGREVRRWPAVDGPSWDIAAVPGARSVVVGAYRPGAPSAVVIDVDTGAVLHRLDRPMARAQVAVSPDGRLAALTGWDARTLLWDLATGEVRHELDGVIGPTIGVAFSPDGSLVATAGFDKQLTFWDAATGERLRTTALPRTGSRLWFTPGGSLLAVTWGWRILDVPLDAHVRFREAVAGLAGDHRARAFAALGWWERVIPELGGEDDPLLRARAALAVGE